MAKTLEEARKELDDEFEQHRGRLKKIHDKLDEVEKAGPEDDLEEKLKELEDTVKEARTGGMVGSGAKGHSKARDEYRKLKDGK
jgi:Skp family chaperone for outer membrane proteins